MSQRDPLLFFADIVKASGAVAEFAPGLPPETADEDEIDRNVTLAGVLYQFVIIGEAAARLPAELREQVAGVPWPDVISLRNRVVHNYFGISLPRVIDVATVDVPALRESVMAYLRKHHPLAAKALEDAADG